MSISQYLASLRGRKQQQVAPQPGTAPAVIPTQQLQQQPQVIYVQQQAPAPVAAPAQQPQKRVPFAVDVQNLLPQLQSQMNFTSGFSDEQIQAAMQNPAMFRQMLNTVGVQALATAMHIIPNQIGNSFADEVSAVAKGLIPTAVSQLSLDQALASHSVYSKNAVAMGLAKERVKSLQSQYPDASPVELLQAVDAEFESAGFNFGGQQQQTSQNATPSATAPSFAEMWGAQPGQQPQTQQTENAGQQQQTVAPQVQFVQQTAAPAPVAQSSFQAGA